MFALHFRLPAWVCPGLLAFFPLTSGCLGGAPANDGPTVTISPPSQRSEQLLNGSWRFQPANSSGLPDEAAWGTVAVPGAWHSRSLLGGILKKGMGPLWDGLQLENLPRAWYERDLLIPAAWAGRDVELDLERVSTDAVVYVDGAKAGQISWPGGKVNITPFAKPGESQKLTIQVLAAASEREVIRYFDRGIGIRERADLAARGMIGDVWLRSLPPGPRIGGVFVRPSVSHNKLNLDLDLVAIPKAGNLSIKVKARDLQGKVEKEFSVDLPVEMRGEQTISATWPWKDARLWDLDHPELYDLEISVQGPQGWQDIFTQRFGFREFTQHGREFFLNGVPFRLRPILLHQMDFPLGQSEAIRNHIQGFREAGFNIQQIWPDDDFERGSLNYWGQWARLADEAGWPLMYPLPSFSPFLNSWAKPAERQEWERRVREAWRKVRNHPSILIYGSTPNRFAHADDQNPLRIGQTPRLGGGEAWEKEVAPAREALKWMQDLDPTRVHFLHHSAVATQLHAVNTYPNMIPLQEREEWPSQWSTQGDIPFSAIEFGNPLTADLGRGRSPFMVARLSEPLLTEHCATYLGAEAYRLETLGYRKSIPESFRGGQNYSSIEQSPGKTTSPFQDLSQLFVRNTWRSWRAWGVSGGMIPWDYAGGWDAWASPASVEKLKPLPAGEPGTEIAAMPGYAYWGMRRWHRNPAGDALFEVNQDTLAFLSGAPEFTDKTHQYESQAEIRKQIVLINDSRKTAEFNVQWDLQIDGARIAGGEEKKEVSPGANAFLPIVMNAPNVTSTKDAILSLKVAVDGRTHDDKLTLRIYPPHPPLASEIMVWDPAGESTAMLEKIGAKAVPWAGQVGGVLVVGRGAFGTKKPPHSLEKFVETGGSLIVLSPQPDVLREMGFRVSRQVSRRVFPLDSVPFSKVSLDATDLTDWPGAGSLIAPRESELSSPDQKDLRFGWHWGNTGSVTSAAIEKPHRSGWTPLLESEFDLAYSPLLELRFGTGKILLCTLDFESRGASNPVGERLLKEILRLAAEPAGPQPEKVVYLGNEAGLKALQQTGVDSIRSQSLPEQGIAVVGGGSGLKEEAFRAFLRKGGKALLLPESMAEFPLGFSTKPSRWGDVQAVPAWPELRGISLSELRFRADYRLDVLTAPKDEIGAGGLLGRIKDGKGVAIRIQAGPETLPADEKTYFRFTRWRLTRLWTQVLANLGASFAADQIFLEDSNGPASVSLSGTWLMRVEQALPAAATSDEGVNDDGRSDLSKGWEAPDLSIEGWKSLEAPGAWDRTYPEMRQMDGAVWLRRVIEIPKDWVGRNLSLHLGKIDDFDETFVNGVQVGGTGAAEKNTWSKSRIYGVPAKLVTSTQLTIAIRVFDRFGEGGFTGGPADLYLTPEPATNEPTLYHPDYRADFELGDDPARYQRW